MLKIVFPKSTAGTALVSVQQNRNPEARNLTDKLKDLLQVKLRESFNLSIKLRA
jgi:hypothetical protein